MEYFLPKPVIHSRKRNSTDRRFPQPKPGAAPSPGPMKVPDEQLRGLGIRDVNYVAGKPALAVIDSTLE